MTHPRPAVHRTILVVDVEGFGDHRRTNVDQVAVRAGLYRALHDAFGYAGISWADCESEDRGDGVLVLVRAEVPKGPFVEALPGALVAALRNHNRSHGVEAKIRLRMALHAGEVNYDEHGVTSAAINLAFRLLDAGPLRAALAGSPGVLALITSSWFFNEVVRHSSVSNPAAYRKVSVTVKETTTTAWIHLPDTPFQSQQGLPASATPTRNSVGEKLRADRFGAARLPKLEDIADQLAIAVGRQWEAEAMLRRLNDPHPLPLSWRHADADLVEDWSFLATTAMNWPGRPPSDPGGWVSAPSDLAGSDSELSDVFSRRVPTGRLVVLGEPGAGKTMLLVRLVLDLLACRESGDLVPVLVPIASWNPSAQDLHTWLAARLVIDNPGLRQSLQTDLGTISRVQALLDGGSLLPILDGFDEMPDRVRGQAIVGINDALRPGDRVVVSSRVTEYRRAVHPADGPAVMLRNAAGITLNELDTHSTTTYLRRDAGSPAAAARWEPVLTMLGTKAPVGQALRTPLMVGLARTIYNPRPGEHTGSLATPAELCDTTRFPTRADVERHLFDAFVPAAYRRHPDPRKRCRWPAADAERWLSFLAGHLEHRLHGTTDLAWWDLRDATPRPLVSLVVGLASGTACGSAAGLGARVGIGIGIGLGIGIVLGFAIGLPIRRVSTVARGPVGGLAGGLMGGLAGGLIAGLASLLDIGRAVGPAGGIGVGLGVGLGVGPASGLVGGITGGFVGGLAAGLMAGFGAGLASGIVNGIGVGLSSGLAAGLAGRRQPSQGLRWSTIGLAGGIAVGIALGLAAWLVAGPAAGLAVGVSTAFVSALVGGFTGTSANLTAVSGPQAVLRRDRRAFGVYGFSVGIATGFTSGLVTGLAATIEEGVAVDLTGLLANGLGIGLAVGFASGLTLGFVQAAWGAFAITRCWLTLRRRLPWRLMSFLADAHERRGVLRQVGAVYQFRHAQLQRRLAHRE